MRRGELHCQVGRFRRARMTSECALAGVHNSAPRFYCPRRADPNYASNVSRDNIGHDSSPSAQANAVKTTSRDRNKSMSRGMYLAHPSAIFPNVMQLLLADYAYRGVQDQSTHLFEGI